MKTFICTICGYVFTGKEPPEFCPQCKAPASKFQEQKTQGLVWADEHRIGVAAGVDPEIIEGLRQIDGMARDQRRLVLFLCF